MGAPYRVPAILHGSSATCSPLKNSILLAWDLPLVVATPADKLNPLGDGFLDPKLFNLPVTSANNGGFLSCQKGFNLGPRLHNGWMGISRFLFEILPFVHELVPVLT